jgi:putative transposase
MDARDPAEAVEVLDLLLKFFGDGERWVRGRLSDRRGNRCQTGASTEEHIRIVSAGEGHRFPAEVIGHAVWLYFRFPLVLRMVEELLAARGIIVRHETVRQWACKFGQCFANQIRRRLPRVGDKWHLDGVSRTRF